MQLKIQLKDCLWVCGRNIECQAVFKPALRAQERRGAKMWRLNDCSAGNLRQLRDRVWKTDEHVILQGLLAGELSKLRPIFQGRKNFSLVLIDWWNSPFWFSKNATYLIFHNYNGIMVRTGQARFLAEDRPPWFLFPEKAIYYELAGGLLRPAALATAPILDVVKRWQRMRDTVEPRRLLYFPFPIVAEDVPLQEESPQYDFTNMGATMGLWFMRDAYASAWLNFANLYCDRQRLIDLIVRFDGRPFKVFDRRRNYSFLPWEELNRIIRQSRFAVCTGGLHQNSVPKFLEYTCLGVPMIGTALPFEFPWIDQCLFAVDAMKISAAELKLKLAQALELQPKLRANCLALRDTLLNLYHPQTLLDLLQDQFDGKPIPAGYLKNV